MVMYHEQCIFIIYDSAGNERNNFQQQPKLAELKFNLASFINLLLEVQLPTSS